MDVIALTAAELAVQVQSAALGPRDVAEAMIAEVERANPALNAIIRFDPELVRSEARRVEALMASGRSLPLAGVPFTVKDNLWVKGQVASQGSALFRDFVAPRDAFAVARLRDSGAMVLGTTNSSEFACKGVTTNPGYGPTRNPWDLRCTPGGSSGGAASAVSAGLGSLGLATDAGGSTRRPAAHTGIVGMKPSQGRIPHPYGFVEPVFGQSVVGILARSTADVLLALNAMIASDPRDPMSLGSAPCHLPPLAGLRVAYSPRLGLGYPVDPDVREHVEAGLRALAAQGCIVEQADPPWPQDTDEAALMPLQLGALAALYGDQWRRDPGVFDADIARQIEQGLQLTAGDMANAWFLRDRLVQVLAGFQETWDLLVTPTTPCVAWPLDQLGPSTIEGRAVSPRGHAVFTPVFNHTFVPACSVPCGLASNGLPIGLQIVGRRFEDGHVLAAAAAIEAAGPAAQRRPHRVS